MTNGAPAGRIEVFTPTELSGWLETTGDVGPVRVVILIDGFEVASTFAAETREGPRKEFRFALADIWDYARRPERLRVLAAGQPLEMCEPIGSFGAKKPKALSVLKAKLGAGFVFNQIGRLRLSKELDKDWQGKTFGIHRRVSDAVKKLTGYEVFGIYGTLLGAVRNGGFISHDVDFDCAYISRHRNGKDAANELKNLALQMIDEGFRVKCKHSCFDVTDDKAEGVKVDLFHLYFDETGILQFPFGIAGETSISADRFSGLREVQFSGGRILIPEEGEEWAECIYGANWRIPNPGFDWRKDRVKRSRDGILSLPMINEVYWADFYANNVNERGSQFSEFATPHLQGCAPVLDIGCGDGRDALALASAGFGVIGIDRSVVAIEHCKEKAVKAGLETRTTFLTVDVSNSKEFQRFLRRTAEQAGESRKAFYLRFFLHSITEAVQNSLLNSIEKYAKGGDVFLGEFRTDKDETQKKIFGGHFRRFQKAEKFIETLQNDHGFEIVYSTESRGLSPYKGEDPWLCRVIARKL